MIAAAAEVLPEFTGRPPVFVDAPHEVYLTDPSVLVGLVTSASDEVARTNRRGVDASRT